MGGERDLIVEPIGKHHNRDAFSCGYEALDQYLKKLATQDVRRMVAAPFILSRESDRKTVIGYYTLSDLAFLSRICRTRSLKNFQLIRLCQSRSWDAWPSINNTKGRDSGNFC